MRQLISILMIAAIATTLPAALMPAASMSSSGLPDVGISRTASLITRGGCSASASLRGTRRAKHADGASHCPKSGVERPPPSAAH